MELPVFKEHIISLWNSLPQRVVGATSLDAFKRGLDYVVEGEFLNGY